MAATSIIDARQVACTARGGGAGGPKTWKDKVGTVLDFRSRRTRKLRSLHRVKDDINDNDYVESDGLGSTGGMLAPSSLVERIYVDTHLSGMIHSALSTQSTLDVRVEEFMELMRVLHAFSNIHRTAAHDAPKVEGATAPGRLRVTSLLSPFVTRAVTGGADRLKSKAKVDCFLGKRGSIEWCE